MANSQASFGHPLASERQIRRTSLLLGSFLGTSVISLVGLVFVMVFEGHGLIWMVLISQTGGIGCLVAVLWLTCKERKNCEFAAVDWNVVEERVMYSFRRIVQRVQGRHSNCVTRTGRTDSSNKDRVFFYATFSGPGEPDDAVCLGVSFRAQCQGGRTECLIDISGESSGTVWAELSAELIEASTTDAIHAVVSALVATEAVADRVESAMEGLLETAGDRD